MSNNTDNKPDNHPKIIKKQLGILLVNLGTPDGKDARSVRRFLKEFLSDQRVIEMSPLLWKPILHTVILPFRPKKVAHGYAKVWMDEHNESPLRYYTQQQAQKLEERLSDEQRSKIVVSYAMRYGNPALQTALEELKQQGCQRILVMPLYPQYSATSTATVNDKVFDVLKSWRWQPALTTLAPYYDHPAYISALGQSIQAYLASAAQKPDVILASYHGLPKENLKKGDPYFCHCAKTTRLLREHLGYSDDYLRMTFQSRFGPKKWLEPATDLSLAALAQQGIKNVAVITPGFSADCLETLEEMNIQNREIFISEGGNHYDVIPCLNASETGIEMLYQLIADEINNLPNLN